MYNTMRLCGQDEPEHYTCNSTGVEEFIYQAAFDYIEDSAILRVSLRRYMLGHESALTDMQAGQCLFNKSHLWR